MKAKHLLSVIIVIAVGIAFALHYLADSIFSSQPILGRAQIPNRIVSTSPAITEILFKLDVGDRIVGVTDYCTFPPKAQAIPKIGGIVKPSLETVLSLKPDLVMLGNLVAWMQPEFQRAQIPTLQLQMYTIPQILSSIDKLGEGVGVRDRAKELIETLEAEIKAAKTRVQDRRRKRAMIVVGRNLGTLSDIYVVGRESFLNDLLTFAGGENIFGSIPLQYPKVSKEEIIARAPEVIIESAHGGKLNAEIEADMKKAWQPLSSVPAIKNEEIYILNDDYLLLPGPRFIQSLKKFKSILHPELSEE